MSFDDYNNGTKGTGGPQWGNQDWESGRRQREVDEQLRQAAKMNEERQARERQEREHKARLDRSVQEYAESIKPKQSFGVNPLGRPQQSSSYSNASVSHSTAVASREPSFLDRLAYAITAPFRWAWSLAKLIFKIALLLLVLLVAVLWLNWDKQQQNLASAPVTGSSVTPSISVDQPSQVATPETRGAEVLATPSAIPVPTAPDPDQAPAIHHKWAIGVTISELTEEDRTRLNLNPDRHGVLVRSVKPGSPAAEGNLAPDDLLISVGRRSVSSVEDVQQAVQHYRGTGRIPVELVRNAVRYSAEVLPIAVADESQ
jgi:hypothetical protein